MLQSTQLVRALLLLGSLFPVIACGNDFDASHDMAGAGGESSHDMAGAGGEPTGGSPGAGGTEPGTCGSGLGGKQGCAEGFRCAEDEDPPRCVDIDECTEALADCSDDSFCVNTKGSFSCEPCPAGFQLDAEQEFCVDVDECATNNGGCGNSSVASCQNSDGGFTCVCHGDSTLIDGTCTSLPLPRVVASVPANHATGVYPAEYYWDPEPGRGVRERVLITLAFDVAMDTDQVTVVLTDAAGVGAPRVLEGTWDAAGQVLTASIAPLEDEPQFPLEDETIYQLEFSSLRSESGVPVDVDDPTYPDAQLAFTTGVRDPLLNHACIHTQHGPFAEVSASTSSTSLFPPTDTAHTHYTISLPPGEAGEPHVGYTTFFPTMSGVYIFYLRDASSLELEAAGYFAGLSDWTSADLEQAPAACHSVDSVVTDPDTGEATTGPRVAGITHQASLSLSDEELYVLRWTAPKDLVEVIVEYAGQP